MSFDRQPVRRAGRVLLAAVVGVALVAPSAQASGDALWQECAQTGVVSANHSQKDFQSALANPPADGNEYSACADLIRTAQKKAAAGGSTSTSTGGTGGVSGGTGGGTTGGGAAAQAVNPGALKSALGASGIDPATPAGSAAAAAPDPVTVGGKQIDLSSDRVPSIGGALSLPLPLAASAVVVLLSAAMPVARYLVARFGGPPTGTSPAG